MSLISGKKNERKRWQRERKGARPAESTRNSTGETNKSRKHGAASAFCPPFTDSPYLFLLFLLIYFSIFTLVLSRIVARLLSCGRNLCYVTSYSRASLILKIVLDYAMKLMYREQQFYEYQ